MLQAVGQTTLSLEIRTMGEIVGDVTAAPKQAFKFAESHLVAFLLIVILLMVLFVRMETKTPGSVVGKVQKIPGLGPWATGRQNPPSQ
jgi:hypothetical protein